MPERPAPHPVDGVRGAHDARAARCACRARDLDAVERSVRAARRCHCANSTTSIAVHLADRDALLTGDALVTLDPYTGARGPQIVAGAATASSETALDSLDALAATGATTVLTGHGPGWRGGIAGAVAAARRRGAH